MPKKVDPALKDRALRMVAEHRSDYPSVTAVAHASDETGSVFLQVSGVSRQPLVVPNWPTQVAVTAALVQVNRTFPRGPG